MQADSFNDITKSGDIFLLCSDGLSGMLGDDAIEVILATPTDDLQDIADALVDAANAAGGLDNVTAVVVKVIE